MMAPKEPTEKANRSPKKLWQLAKEAFPEKLCFGENTRQTTAATGTSQLVAALMRAGDAYFEEHAYASDIGVWYTAGDPHSSSTVDVADVTWPPSLVLLQKGQLFAMLRYDWHYDDHAPPLEEEEEEDEDANAEDKTSPLLKHLTWTNNDAQTKLKLDKPFEGLLGPLPYIEVLDASTCAERIAQLLAAGTVDALEVCSPGCAGFCEDTTEEDQASVWWTYLCQA